MLKSLNATNVVTKCLVVTVSISGLSSSDHVHEGTLIQNGKAPQNCQFYSKTKFELPAGSCPAAVTTACPCNRGGFSSVWEKGFEQGIVLYQGLSMPLVKSALLETGAEVPIQLFRAFSRLGLGFPLSSSSCSRSNCNW